MTYVPYKPVDIHGEIPRIEGGRNVRPERGGGSIAIFMTKKILDTCNADKSNLHLQLLNLYEMDLLFSNKIIYFMKLACDVMYMILDARFAAFARK